MDSGLGLNELTRVLRNFMNRGEVLEAERRSARSGLLVSEVGTIGERVFCPFESTAGFKRKVSVVERAEGASRGIRALCH